MNEKLREELVSGIEKAFLKVGAQSYESGTLQAKKLLALALDGIQNIQSKDGLRTILDSFPPMTRRNELMLRIIVNRMPHLLRFGLTTLSKIAKSNLPSFPAGRPSLYTGAKAQEVIDCVKELYGKGISFSAAKERASWKFQLSVRTVERLWARRASILEDNPSVQEALAFFLK